MRWVRALNWSIRRSIETTSGTEVILIFENDHSIYLMTAYDISIYQIYILNILMNKSGINFIALNNDED